MPDSSYIRWFSDLGRDDVALVGGKNASLGELCRRLKPLGVEVPDGFALTAAAFRDALTAAGAWDGLHALLDGLDKADVERLARTREIVYAAGLTPDMEEQLRTAFRALLAEYGEGLTVAVRSSATAEDLPTASFAGQHETYLNVAGEAMLLDAVRRCHASLFTDRAISYRIDQGFDHFKVALSVGVQKMVRSDLCLGRGNVHARHGVGIPGCRVHHRRLWAGKNGCPGNGRSRRVLRAQADRPTAC